MKKKNPTSTRLQEAHLNHDSVYGLALIKKGALPLLADWRVRFWPFARARSSLCFRGWEQKVKDLGSVVLMNPPPSAPQTVIEAQGTEKEIEEGAKKNQSKNRLLYVVGSSSLERMSIGVGWNHGQRLIGRQRVQLHTVSVCVVHGQRADRPDQE